MIDASNCTIDNLVTVVWLDHSSPHGTWHTAKELEDCMENVAETMTTAGWIVSETDDRYLVVSTANTSGSPGETIFSDVNMILKSTVKEIRKANGQKLQRVKVKRAQKRSGHASKKKSTQKAPRRRAR